MIIESMRRLPDVPYYVTAKDMLMSDFALPPGISSWIVLPARSYKKAKKMARDLKYSGMTHIKIRKSKPALSKKDRIWSIYVKETGRKGYSPSRQAQAVLAQISYAWKW